MGCNETKRPFWIGSILLSIPAGPNGEENTHQTKRRKTSGEKSRIRWWS
jgi:hypothetical protein